MSSRIARLLALFAGLTAVALLCASQASAAGAWRVRAGSAKAGTKVAVTGHTIGKRPQIHFRDVTTGQTLTCASGRAPGTAKVGRGLSNPIGHINGKNTTWNTCKGPAGLTFKVHGINPGGHQWNLNATSFAAPVTHGNINNIKARVVDRGVCSFTVTGRVGVRYSNKTHNLTVPGKRATLHISHVSGCLGVIKNKNNAKFHATYRLRANRAAFNPITITHA